MRIAMFGHKRIPSREGGVEVVVEQLSTRMAAMGHRVTCYNRKGKQKPNEYTSKSRYQYKGVDVFAVPTIDKRGLAAVTSSFFAAIRCAFGNADVVHIHAEGPAFMCWLPRLFGKRVIVTVHGLDWQREKWNQGFGSKYIYAGEKMTARFAHEIIVLSRNVQEYFKSTYGREAVWIPNGVTKPEIQEADCITQQFGLKKDEYVLFLGRLVPEKGIHYLIEAFRDVKTDKKLVIAGGASDTDTYVQRLRELAKEDERVLFSGFVQGKVLKEMYSNAYLYVLPSDVEGMPLSLLEAMSYGNCCLVSDIPECTEVVEEYAVSFHKSDVEDLRCSLQELCDDPVKTASYKVDASRVVCEKYNWDHVVEQTMTLYSGKAAEFAAVSR